MGWADGEEFGWADGGEFGWADGEEFEGFGWAVRKVWLGRWWGVWVGSEEGLVGQMVRSRGVWGGQMVRSLGGQMVRSLGGQ